MTTRPARADGRCPFCALAAGAETERNRESDVVHRDAETLAFVSPKWWLSNPAHVLVTPTRHYENLYQITEDDLARVYATAKRVAVALKRAYRCDGTSTRQHNEVGGGQDVPHFHVHVFPRYANDRLYERNVEIRWPTPVERAERASLLRNTLAGE